MSEEHRDKTESELIAIDNNIWVPPRLAKDRKKIERLQKKRFTQKIGLAGKTPLEIFQLLLLPVVLAASGYWYSFTQAQSSQRGHAIDIQIAVDQQRETLLKTCLDDIKDLLLNKRLRGSQVGDEVRVVARVEVLETLRHLDGGRKRLLILFLSEAKLITMERNDVIIDLSNANLSRSDLIRADLRGANLFGADLSHAILPYANLSHAILIHTGMSGAKLIHADLSYVDLRGARITRDQLKEAASLKKATMPDGSKHP